MRRAARIGAVFGFALQAIAAGPIAIYISDWLPYLLAVAAVAAAPFAWTQARRPDAPTAGAALFLVWAAGAALWAPDLSRSAGVAWRAWAIGLCVWTLLQAQASFDPAIRRRIAQATTCGFVFSLAIMIAEAVQGYDWMFVNTVPPEGAVGRFDRGAIMLALLAWPAAAAMASLNAARIAGIAPLAAFSVVLAFRSVTAVAAPVLGAFGATAALLRGRIRPAWFFGVVALAVLATPPIVGLAGPAVAERVSLPASHDVRAGLWRSAWDAARDAAPWGRGLDASRDPDPATGARPFGTHNHPHNAPAQILFELGPVGLILLASWFAALVAYPGGGWSRTDEALRLGYLAGVALIFLVWSGAWEIRMVALAVIPGPLIAALRRPAHGGDSFP